MKNNYIVIDAGGTNIKLGLITDGNLIKSTSISSFSENGLVNRLSEISKITKDWLQSQKVDGIGLAFAGIVDFDKACVISVNDKFKDTTNFNFTNWAFSALNCPIVMENDARAALIGEWKYGAGRSSDNVVMLTLGTGIGGSAVINGKILRGSHYQAGCLLGHFTIDYLGKKCNCGNIGCVETVASTWALPEIVKGATEFKLSSLATEVVIDFETIFRLANKGDILALKIREQCLKTWAVATVNAIHAYDPEIVVLGGGVMKSGDVIIKYIKRYIDQFAWTPWGKVELKIADLENDAALWGMYHLLNEKFNNYKYDKLC